MQPLRHGLALRRWRAAAALPGRQLPDRDRNPELLAWAERSGINSVAAVNRLVLRRYLAHLASEGFAKRSAARHVAALRRYFGFLVRQALVVSDPTTRLHAPSDNGRLPRVLTRTEIDNLLDPSAETERIRSLSESTELPAEFVAARNVRDQAVLELLYGSGLRVSEVCGLSDRSIDWGRAFVNVLGKGNKERLVPLSEPTVAVLRRWTSSSRAEFVRQIRHLRRAEPDAQRRVGVRCEGHA